MSNSLRFIPTTVISNGKKSVTIGKVGHGIMSFTARSDPPPDEECFEALKTSMRAVPEGCKMLINAGEFYGRNPREANLELLARFYEKNPEFMDKTFLSVKGGVTRSAAGMAIDGSTEGMRKSINNCLTKLRNTKRLDLYECARIDPKVPVEETIKAISEYVADGKIDFIGMSECRAETLRRGHAVHPITMIEIEVNPWSNDQKVKDVIETSKELGVAVAAYSPLGRGYLAGKFESIDDLPKDDLRRTFDRFQPGNIEANKAIVEELKTIAAAKGITSAELCIAWVSSRGSHVIPIPGSSHFSRTAVNTHAASITLTPEELEAVDKVLAAHPVQGSRYMPGTDEQNHIWG